MKFEHVGFEVLIAVTEEYYLLGCNALDFRFSQR
jgi:hypothetical protein